MTQARLKGNIAMLNGVKKLLSGGAKLKDVEPHIRKVANNLYALLKDLEKEKAIEENFSVEFEDWEEVQHDTTD